MARILIVDDWNIELIFRNGVSKLREQGHFLRQAGDCYAAMSDLQEKRYDLVVIDLSEDNYVSGKELLSEAVERLYPSTIRACWSAQYSLYPNRLKDIDERFHYRLNKSGAFRSPIDRILEIIEQEKL